MRTGHELGRDRATTRLHDTRLDKGSFEVIHALQLGKRFPCVKDLVVSGRHLGMRLVTLTDARTSIGQLERPASDTGRLAVL
jgi:hypothetical protein